MGGSHRTTIQTGQPVPPMSWEEEVRELPDAWPYLGPTWLAATEKALPSAQPWHTVARRGHGEVAWLPGFVLTSPGEIDFDPRVQLGWQPPTGERACCGVEAPGEATAEVNAMGEEAFYPALLLGSPLGYRSEAAYTFWTPSLLPEMLNTLIPAAFGAGIRSIALPWIPERRGNDAIVTGLTAAGGHAAVCGCEDFLAVDAPSYEAYVQALPAKRRRRLQEDLNLAAAVGAEIRRHDGGELRPLIPRIAELAARNREKYGAAGEADRISMMLGALLDAGVTVSCHTAVVDGLLVGACVTIRKQRRLFVKWAGVDAAALGERSGVYFALVLDAPVRQALAEGARIVEYGSGSHQAKALRGCQPRRLTSALLLADRTLRAQAAQLLDAYAAAQRASSGLVEEVPAVLEPVSGGASCCP